MTNPNLTEIVIIADRSGSMHFDDQALETMNGINRLLEEQKLVEGECNITLAIFDDKYDLLYDGIPLNTADPLRKDVFFPRGMTSLLDAVGKTAQAVGARLASTPEDQRPSRVLVVVATDGGENSSVEYNFRQVSEMIKHQQDKYSWDFTFMGAGTEAWAQAASLGFASNKSVLTQTSAAGTRSIYSSISKGFTRSRRGDSSYLDNIQSNYSAEVKKQEQDNDKRSK